MKPDRFECRSMFPPDKWVQHRGQMRAYCTRGIWHPGDHKAGTGTQGGYAMVWRKRWAPSPLSGGPQFLGRWQKAGLYAIAAIALAAIADAPGNLSGWQWAGLGGCVICFRYCWRTLRDDRVRRREHDQMVILQKGANAAKPKPALNITGWDITINGKTWALPRPPYSTVNGPISGCITMDLSDDPDFQAKLAKLGDLIALHQDLQENQQRVLIRQVMNPRG